MFEGLVRQLLLGYLGRYIKDFQKEQLKITLWNEEVVFENVELILEAFDYLQLPFALRQGRVGRLSIKIPWKKLGWDPIIICLEDVYFCVSQRDHHEWSVDAVERRELAAKKAKLAAAELAKLSRRVCDNQAGQSFISHISGKILDNIQVSIRKAHILYHEMQSNSMQILFGLKFSSLTIMKQSPTSSVSWKARSGQVSKIVKICNLGIYCNTFQGSLDLTCPSAINKAYECDFILRPFDISVLVIKLGKFEHDLPQYSIAVELEMMALSIDSSQLQHILALLDYLCLYQLREKYGRYRPWNSPLWRKLKGWQKVWWQYAQESVLSNVRKKLKKTSWKYLGQRLGYRRKYVNLYKIKLSFLQKEQPIDETVIQELEQMEKDSDVDDILSFRAIAEQELEEALSKASIASGVTEDTSVAGEKIQNDESSTGRTRGWLNWLSRGVLGAGGTDDSTQFSGIVSDEIIKDICEATKFQPMLSHDCDAAATGATIVAAISLSVNQISLLIQSMKTSQDIVELNFYKVSVESKILEESTAIVAKIESAEIVNSSKRLAILKMKRNTSQTNGLGKSQASISIQVDVSSKTEADEFSVKVMLQPLEVHFDLEVFLNLIDIYNILRSFKFQQDRVLMSLNGVEDVKHRLFSKAECILSNRRRVMWDIHFTNMFMYLPWCDVNHEQYHMVLESGALHISSKCDYSPLDSGMGCVSDNIYDSASLAEIFCSFQLEEIYDCYEINIYDFQIVLILPCNLKGIPVVEKLSASATVACCIIPEEVILRQLEVRAILSLLHLQISPSIYGAIWQAVNHLQLIHQKLEQRGSIAFDLPDVRPVQAMPFHFSVAANLQLVKMEVNLEDDGDNSSALVVNLHQLNMRYVRREFQDGWVSLKALKIISHPLGALDNSQILCSSGFLATDSPLRQQDLSYQRDDNGCFLLSYKGHQRGHLFRHVCGGCLDDIEFHCYPKICNMLVRFCDKLASYHRFVCDENSFRTDVFGCSIPFHAFGFERFGFSNFCENGFHEWESIPLSHFPFVTIYNSGSLCNLEDSLICPPPDWKKKFSLKDKRTGSPTTSKTHLPLLCFFSEGSLAPVVDSAVGWNLVKVDLDIRSIKLHFHDSSCVVGSLSLPVGKCSIISQPDCFEVLWSTKDLRLSSPWYTREFQEFLWGPSSCNLSPVLNIRVRNSVSLSKSHLELSFSIQHVNCILAPEFLGILIGYFCLPDWNSNDSSHQVTQSKEQNEDRIIYKFEILDCIMMSPLESSENCFLKLEAQQLYVSFIENDASQDALKGVFSECMVQSEKIADRTNSLNIFGRDLCLSLSMFDDQARYQCCSFIQSFSVDLWMRMPFEYQSSDVSSTFPTCVMARILNCEVVAEDDYFNAGFEALLDVVDRYSMIEKDSKCYSGDVAQFFVLRNSIMEGPNAQVDVSSNPLTEINCCVQSLSIRLCHARRNSKAQKMVAKIDTELMFSASLKTDIILALDVHFSSLELSSLLTYAALAKFSAESSVLSVLDIHLSTTRQGKIMLLIVVPSLEIWLYLAEWTMVVDLLTSCFQSSPKKNVVNASCNSTHKPSSPNSLLSACETCTKSGIFNVNPVALCMRSERISISIHFPVCVSEESEKTSEKSNIDGETASHVPNLSDAKDCKFITIVLHSRDSELLVNGRVIKLRFIFDRATGSVRVYDCGIIQSWPLFQLFQLHAEANILHNKLDKTYVKTSISCETFDVWVSHQLLYFWLGLEYGNSMADSSIFVIDDVQLNIRLKKVSLLLTDGRWSCNGPLMELFMRNLLLETSITGDSIQCSLLSDLLINYNNIHKGLWEPFMEPWNFQVSLIQKHAKGALLDSAVMTDIDLKSTAQLNLNITESLIEALVRAVDMIKDASGLIRNYDVSERQNLRTYQPPENLFVRRYAPYMIHNMTSLPLVFHVYQGLVADEDTDISTSKYTNNVPSGASIPIYIDAPFEEQVLNFGPSHSSEGIKRKLSNSAGHHFMRIQFEGTSEPSEPMSMDLVGLTCFEMNFSEENNRSYASSGFLVPVVFDVSVQRYSKLIRLYSTVILKNSTDVPLELRFDIPFGISPKIADPVYPCEEFPLPLHLAEAGRIRWRPVGENYLWSESHSLSNILSQERSGLSRSPVCYPSHPSSDPFRCCLSVQNVSLPRRRKRGSSQYVNGTLEQMVEMYGQMHILKTPELRFIHRVTLSSPLFVRNYLPEEVSLTIEGSGVNRNAILSGVETSFFHIDSSHDLAMMLHINGFKSAAIRFPRAETFAAMAKLSGTLLSLTETIKFDAEFSAGPLYVMVEKVMNASSGSRELHIAVPFLLYNCTGFAFNIINSSQWLKGNCYTVPSCYDSIEQELHLIQKDGLSIISSGQDSYSNPSHSLSKKRVISSMTCGSSANPCQSLEHIQAAVHNSCLKHTDRKSGCSSQSDMKTSNFADKLSLKAKPFMYSPDPDTPANQIMVRLSRCFPEHNLESEQNSLWSSSFSLVVPGTSTTVYVPLSSSSSVSPISVTSSLLDGLTGRTRAISFQPRYVISNACSRDLCYKQKGTGFAFHLGVGEHSHLHWPDTQRELFVTIRFDEPGCQWSGSFKPDHLGDKQVKMRNYVSGALYMICVEVQTADVVVKDESTIGNASGYSGTNIIILSDDDTGFIPYRIDNFSKETLRVYQQKCETLETIVQPYTSCPYAWDEPYNPHRLIVEVPGERIVGSYTLDNVKEYAPVHLPSSSEKDKRTLLSSVHAEGAIKVLSIIDSSYHFLRDVNDPNAGISGERRKQEEETIIDYKENISFSISFIGISLINSSPRELLFASAKDMRIDFSQSVEQQIFSFQISCLQIDNQLRNTPYPVILSFDSHRKWKDDSMKSMTESLMPLTHAKSGEPIVRVSAAKWRNKDARLVSFREMSLRITDFHLELDQELLLSLFDFFRAAILVSQSPDMMYKDSGLGSYAYKVGEEHLPRTESLSSEHSKNCRSLPEVVPIGAPWQKVSLLARRQDKIYVEAFRLDPVKLTLSFSSSPWVLKNSGLVSRDSLIHRGLMALADIEGAQICLGGLAISHDIASWESIQKILIKHYTKRVIPEMYKVFGSAGVIGNPIGVARTVGHGIKEFLSVPAKSVLQSPTGLITGIAQGTTTLLSNTMYAMSDATTQFSKAAHKGILAFTFDDQDVSKMETQPSTSSSRSKGVISELLEGLTGLLQSPIKGAEKHGLPGVLSGFALGVTGLVARPAASVLAATGKTAHSIRSRSKLYHMGHQRYRVRLPRPLSRELALRPYSWEEAIGTAVLMEIDGGLKFKDEVLVMCKLLKDSGKSVILTERLILIVHCPSLIDLGKPEFQGIPAEPEWIIQVEIGLESVIHADAGKGIVHIVATSSQSILTQKSHQQRAGGRRLQRWDESATTLPLFQTNLELACEGDANYFLRVLLATIEQGKEQGWGNVYLVHQSNLKQ